jgi:dipeptidase D
MEPQTASVLELFEQISAIPRASKQEARIAGWLRQWAEGRGLAARGDAAGNLLIAVPASPGLEAWPAIVLQAHMDMVCERSADSRHDFTRDPIRPLVSGEWLTAQGTSLGADNGIGMALAMDLAADRELRHGPLELLFTVDEESGLTGAKELSPDLVSGRILINIDSEEEGVFTIGCAGGRETRLRLDLPCAPLPPGMSVQRLAATGLLGGHSGIDINSGRVSALKILARALEQAKALADIRLVAISGGTAHNAIAREAEALLAIGPAEVQPLGERVQQWQAAHRAAATPSEPSLSLTLAPLTAPIDAPAALTAEASARAIHLLSALPHGVAEMDPTIPQLVRTSSNLARARLQAAAATPEGAPGSARLEILCSQRSLLLTRLLEITGQVEAVAALAGGTAETSSGYPPWPPDPSSALLARCTRLWQRLFDTAARVEVLHAGLECAVIGALYPGMQMISCGPTMKYPHSPDERLHIPSVGRMRRFLAQLLASAETPA